MKPKAFIPGKKFPDVSITGTACPLNCNYCQGHYLRGMELTPTPKKLYETVRYLVRNGAKGVLISGGFNLDGTLPVEPFLPIIREIKKDFDIVVSVHSGLVNKELAIKLREAKVDIVDYELIIDHVVIRDVMKLKKRKSEDFIKSFEILEKYGPPFVAPHVPIGFNYGRIVKEKETIDLIADYDPYVLIYLIFIPTKGTPMENAPIPDVKNVIELIKYGKERFKGETALGCMRPWIIKYVLDPLAYKLELVDRIVNPLKKHIEMFNMDIVEACCSVPKELLDKFY